MSGKNINDAEMNAAIKEALGLNEEGDPTEFFYTKEQVENLLALQANPFLKQMKDLGHTAIAMPIGAYQFTINTGSALSNRLALKQLYRVYKSETLTGFQFLQQTQGAYTAADYNGIKIYSMSGVTATAVVGGETTNDGNLWKSAAGLVTKALPAPITLSAGLYAIVFVYNQSAETTAPKLSFFGASYNTYSPLGLAVCRSESAQASLPGSYNMSSGSTNTAAFAVWPY